MTLEKGTQKAQALDTHKDQVVVSLNSMVKGRDISRPVDVRKVQREIAQRQNFMEKSLTLIDDNTLPNLTDALGEMLGKVAEDENLKSALCDFLCTKVGLDPHTGIALIRKMLDYQHSKDVVRAVARIVSSNQDFLHESMRELSQFLLAIPDSDITGLLMEILAMEIDKFQFRQEHIWLVRLDSKNNPVVLYNNKGELYPPFVDQDWDGECDTDNLGRPIDINGNVINIWAFDSQEYWNGKGKILVKRDQYRRAVSPKGRPIFQYFDAQKTILSSVLYNAGRCLAKNIHRDLQMVGVEALNPLKEYTDSSGNRYLGYSDKSHLYKTLQGMLKVLKNQQARYLVNGFLSMLGQNPTGTEASLKGMGKLIWMLKDGDLNDPKKLGDYMLEIIDSKKIPELIDMLEIMSKIQVPGSGYPNMTLLFMMYLQGNV